MRFTSNIAGPIFLAADILCIILSVPLALAGYILLRGVHLVASVNLFAFAAAAGAYLLIRASRQAYHRTLVNLFDHEADAVIDALSSVLIASALVWQFGMIANLSRGITLLYLGLFHSLPDAVATADPADHQALGADRRDRATHRLLRCRPGIDRDDPAGPR